MKMSERYKQAVYAIGNDPHRIAERKRLVAQWVKWRLIEMCETLGEENYRKLYGRL